MILSNLCRQATACVTSAPVSTKSKGRFAWHCQRSLNLRNILPLMLVALVFSFFSSAAHSQAVTATLSGTVEDSSGGVIPNAQVTLTNEATADVHQDVSNGTGLYVFPSLVPGSYSVEATAKGFVPRKVTGVVLHAGDQRALPAFTLAVGSENQTVVITADQQMIPVENGSKVNVLTAEDIDNLALQGQDTTELLKVLPGATTVSG